MRVLIILAVIVVVAVLAIALWARARAAARRRVEAENGARWEVDTWQSGDDTRDETTVGLRLMAHDGRDRHWQIGPVAFATVITTPLTHPDYAGELGTAVHRAAAEAALRNTRRALRHTDPA